MANSKSIRLNSIFGRIYRSSVFGILSILIVMCAILTLLTNKFLTVDNLLSVTRQFSFIAFMAIGECLVIITGGIDLSVGSVFAFSGVVSGMAMRMWGVDPIVSMFLGLIVGAAFGLLNGLFVTLLNLPPFISTLGIMSVARGLSYGITGGFPIPIESPVFKSIGQGYAGPIPIPIILLVIVGILFSLFLQKTVTGRHIYALGGNEEGARVSGINVKHIKRVVFALSGLMAGLAGIATAARLGVAQSTAGQGYELDAIAAVIIGGASVSGGVGTVFGAILGAAIMGVLKNALVLLSVTAYWQQTVIGCVVLLAVSMDHLRYRGTTNKRFKWRKPFELKKRKKGTVQ